jgi:hypothetical protein
MNVPDPLLAILATLMGLTGGVLSYFFNRKRVKKAAEDKAAESMSVTIRNLAATVEDLTNTLHNDLPHIEEEIRAIKGIQIRMAEFLLRLRKRISALEKRMADADDRLPPTP